MAYHPDPWVAEWQRKAAGHAARMRRVQRKETILAAAGFALLLALAGAGFGTTGLLFIGSLYATGGIGLGLLRLAGKWVNS